MHQDLGLRQRTVDQQRANPLPESLLPLIELNAQVATHIPFGEEFKLSTQQGLVIAGQRRIHRQLLKGQQRLNGVLEQTFSVVAVDHVQKGFIAQIVKQQEPALQVLSINFRDIYLADS